MHISIEIALGHTHTHLAVTESVTEPLWCEVSSSLSLQANSYKQLQENKRVSPEQEAKCPRISTDIHIVLVPPCRAPKEMLSNSFLQLILQPAWTSRPTMCETNTYGKGSTLYRSQREPEKKKKKKAKVPYIKSLKTYMLCYSSEHEYYLHMVYYKHLENSVDSK